MLYIIISVPKYGITRTPLQMVHLSKLKAFANFEQRAFEMTGSAFNRAETIRGKREVILLKYSQQSPTSWSVKHWFGW